jgi:T5SS/PEP-CTERM-associated repeat protein
MQNDVPSAAASAVFDVNSTYTVNVNNPTVDKLLVHDGTVRFSGMLTSKTGVVDGHSGRTATVKLTGGGSGWRMTDVFEDPRTLVVGDTGSGVVAIADGAVLDTTRARLGQNAGSHGKVTVNGAGSIFKAPEMRVGVFGKAPSR